MGEAKRKARAPSLASWLETQGSQKPEERDDFVAFTEWTQKMLDRTDITEPRAREALLMTNATSLAIIESCNNAMARGMHAGDALVTMSKSMGVALGYALMSLDWKEDTPHRSFPRMLGEEFIAGVKYAIDNVVDGEAEEDAQS